MAFRHGSKAEVVINSVDLSAYCDSLSLDVSVDTSDVTAFGSTWRSHIAGLAGATMSLSGSYDPTATTGPAAALFACISGGVPVTVVDKPGGTLTGQRTNTFSAIVTSYGEASSMDDKITFSAELLVTGAVYPTVQ